MIRVGELVAAMPSGSNCSARVSDLRDAESVSALMRCTHAALNQVERDGRNALATAAR